VTFNRLNESIICVGVLSSVRRFGRMYAEAGKPADARAIENVGFLILMSYRLCGGLATQSSRLRSFAAILKADKRA
jgi:hypothetical protein